MDWRANGANTLKPGLQLVVDIDGNGIPDGILVGERSYANGAALYRENFGITNWWLTTGSRPGVQGPGPVRLGRLWLGLERHARRVARGLAAEATVTHAGWSLGSGVKGDGVIESITVGLTTYTFTGANQAPVAEDATVSSVAGGSISFPLPASDADGDALTYTIEGSADADGVLEHTFSLEVRRDADVRLHRRRRQRRHRLGHRDRRSSDSRRPRPRSRSSPHA